MQQQVVGFHPLTKLFSTSIYSRNREIPQILFLTPFWHPVLITAHSIRSKVYTPRPANLDALEANLRAEIAILDPNMLTRALGDMNTRAQLCLANNGGYFEK